MLISLMVMLIGGVNIFLSLKDLIQDYYYYPYYKLYLSMQFYSLQSSC